MSGPGPSPSPGSLLRPSSSQFHYRQTRRGSELTPPRGTRSRSAPSSRRRPSLRDPTQPVRRNAVRHAEPRCTRERERHDRLRVDRGRAEQAHERDGRDGQRGRTDRVREPGGCATPTSPGATLRVSYISFTYARPPPWPVRRTNQKHTRSLTDTTRPFMCAPSTPNPPRRSNMSKP